MKLMKLDNDGNIIGFFDPKIHNIKNISDDFVEINEEEWQEALKNNYRKFQDGQFHKEKPKSSKTEGYSIQEMLMVLFLKDDSVEYQKKFNDIKEYLKNLNTSKENKENKENKTIINNLI